MLPLEETIGSLLSMLLLGQGSFFAVVLMTGDSQLRMRDIEGFCDTPSPPQKKLSGQEAIEERT